MSNPKKDKEFTTEFVATPEHLRVIYPQAESFNIIFPNGFQLIQEPGGEITLRLIRAKKDRISEEVYRLKEKKLHGQPLEQYLREPHLPNEMIIIREVLLEATFAGDLFKEMVDSMVKMVTMEAGRKQNAP